MSSQPSRALHRFTLLTAVAALALIGLGGLVTSHGAGMAVPDWPNSYGYNMFFFPISDWVGGVFYEHTHRLLASGVGLLTIILALWFYGTAARLLMRWAGLSLIAVAIAIALAMPIQWTNGLVLGLTGVALFAASFVWPRSEPCARWLRTLGLIAFVAVVLQGVLGGLRVVWCKDALGIFHAALAQLFLVLLCALALFTSAWWGRRTRQMADGNWQVANGSPRQAERTPAQAGSRGLKLLFFATTAVILGQLILGAAMRHQHAGLAIPDFPLAYGKLWPAMDPASVASYNQHRMEVTTANPITATQIVLQMVHRMVAVLIFAAVAACAWSARRKLGASHVLAKLALVWLGLILAQVFLGAATIWSNKAADIATAHVVIGALCLAVGTLLSILSSGEVVLIPGQTAPVPADHPLAETPLTPRPSATASSQ